MDTIATFELAKTMSRHHCVTAVHKHYTVEDWIAFANENPTALPFVAASAGSGDFDKLVRIVEATGVELICLDVANGYSEHFVDFVRKVRQRLPDKTIIAGNVVTGEMTEELLLSGADIVKVCVLLSPIDLDRLELDLAPSARLASRRGWDTRSSRLSSSALTPLTVWEDTSSLMAVVLVPAMLPRLSEVALILSCSGACWRVTTSAQGR